MDAKEKAQELSDKLRKAADEILELFKAAPEIVAESPASPELAIPLAAEATAAPTPQEYLASLVQETEQSGKAIAAEAPVQPAEKTPPEVTRTPQPVPQKRSIHLDTLVCLGIIGAVGYYAVKAGIEAVTRLLGLF